MSNTIVRTNVMSLNSHRNLGLVGNQQNRASQRLSSGFRINSAADDAAGLGISEKMRSQIRGLDQASRNGQDGISLIQTAEGAMSTINEMVTRVRELVIQAANDTNAHNDLGGEATWSQSDRTRIQAEINQILDEIDATRNRVEFNTRRLIDGSLGSRGATTAPAMSAEMRALFEEFMADGTNAADIDNWLALQEDNEALREFMDDVIAFNGQMAGIQTFIGAAGAFSPGMLAAVQDAVSAAIDEWVERVADGDITNTTEAQQALFLNEAVVRHLNEQNSDINLAVGAITLTAAQWTVDTPGGSIGVNSTNAIATGLGAVAATVDAIRTAFAVAMVGQLDQPTAPTTTGDPVVGNSADAYTPIAPPATWIIPAAVTTAWVEAFDAGDLLADIATEIGVATLGANEQERLLNEELADNEDWAALYEAFGDIETLLEAANAPDVAAPEGPGVPLWFQIGANANQGVHLSIEDVGVAALAEVGTRTGAVVDAILGAFEREGNQLPTGMTTEEQREWAAQFTFDNLRSFLDGDTYATSTAYGATGGVLRMSGEEINLFITSIDLALSHVTDQRSNLGAMQNRLEFTIENLDIASENLSAAESRIRDADMAREMMRLTQANVLQQAAISMLAQANQAPQSVLQLLG